MKVLAAALLALLLATSCSPATAHLDAIPTSCCFTYQKRPVPRGLIASGYITSSNCPQPAVIVITKKKRQLCVHPQEPWVQEHLRNFKVPQN